MRPIEKQVLAKDNRCSPKKAIYDLAFTMIDSSRSRSDSYSSTSSELDELRKHTEYLYATLRWMLPLTDKEKQATETADSAATTRRAQYLTDAAQRSGDEAVSVESCVGQILRKPSGGPREKTLEDGGPAVRCQWHDDIFIANGILPVQPRNFRGASGTPRRRRSPWTSSATSIYPLSNFCSLNT